MIPRTVSYGIMVLLIWPKKYTYREGLRQYGLHERPVGVWVPSAPHPGLLPPVAQVQAHAGPLGVSSGGGGMQGRGGGKKCEFLHFFHFSIYQFFFALCALGVWNGAGFVKSGPRSKNPP